ncbi:M20/M25/M40 family metallo-hydrolase [Leifsonia sp. NPDC058292]|uniref:M20/M25/M40 family metallo-hydrolase n=1 Tax=Leifsonia sp. NPDC058292 TaxID=3346428 RepID=UPI0036DA1049
MVDVVVRPGVAERLSRMIQLPTVSAELSERGLGPFHAFRDLLDELYPAIAETLEFVQVGELGLLYRWRGRVASEPIVLMAHYDVVPAVEGHGWTHPPFEGRVDAGVVHGRGALDDKGPLIVIVEAVENLLTAGFVPERDVYLSFGGDEETDGTAAQAIVAWLAENGVEPTLVIDEGGAVVDSPLPFVKVSAAMVGLGEKGIATVRLTTSSAGGHASAPPKTTATTRLAKALTRLEPNPFPKKTPVAIREMLRSFLPHTSGVSRVLLRVLVAAPWLTARVFARMGGEPAALVQTTVAATMLDAGTAANVLAPTAHATLNLRIATGQTVDSTLAQLRRAIRDRDVAIELVSGSDPSPESPADGAAFEALSAAVAAAFPESVTAPYLMMQATDSRFIHRTVASVFRFAPLRMSAAQRGSIHGLDEQVHIESLHRGEEFHRALITGMRPPGD